MELNESQLEQLRLVELDIFQDVDRICRTNGIKYSLASGSLIGAVRHGGFIPWDDDIDLMMERKQYEKFLKIADSKLSKKFYVVDYKKSKNYGFPFAKVMAYNTIMREKNLGDREIPDGVFIDIFPIDYSPKIKYEKLLQYHIAQKIKGQLLCRSGYYFKQSFIKRLFYKIKGKILLCIPKKFLIDLYEYNACVYNSHEKTTEVVSLCRNCGVKNATGKVACFNDYLDLSFEGINAMVIAGYNEWLTCEYGDYMQLPPKSEQIPHHFVNVFSVDNYFDIKKVI